MSFGTRPRLIGCMTTILRRPTMSELTTHTLDVPGAVLCRVNSRGL